MSDTATAPEFVRIEGMDQAPACFSSGWIPDIGVFPELTQALADNRRLREAWDTAVDQRRDVEERIEADTERRKAALRDAYLAGEREPQVQGEDESLRAELAGASERSQAAASAFVEHINRTIALVIAHRQEWSDALDAYNASVNEEIEAVLAKAQELQRRFGDFGRIQHWLHRTGVEGAQMPFAHFAFADIPAPITNQAEELARLDEFFERSYAGGLSPQRRATAGEARDLEEGVLSAPSQEATRSGEVDLHHVEDDDLVDWLMGTGMFDGDPCPSAELVVKAAEGDPAMAKRLLAAEQVANVSAPRQDVVDQLTEIAKGASA